MNNNQIKLAVIVNLLKSNLKNLEFEHFENIIESTKLAELRIRIEQLEQKIHPWKKFDKN
jgi:hypothetical protein|tara:strand:- start:21806 stop:21985 length:180 start_codon:yes stop_codon:yes gene_type:complete